MTVAQKSECPLGGGHVAKTNTETTERAPILAPSSEDGKLLANLKAAFALRGHSVFELAEGGYLVSRWGLARACPDLSALAAFARQIGARA